LEINSKVIVITGGAKGLGFAMAKSLHQKGGTICILDIDNDAIQALPNEMDGYTVDLKNAHDLHKIINHIQSKYKKIDVLINNAGIIHSEPMVNLLNQNMMHSYENFKKIISGNLDTTFIASSAVIEVMIKNRTEGLIINISSISANGNIGQTAYSAAKSGVIAMTKTWAKELGVFGIRCVAISPGFIDTNSTYKSLNKNIIEHIKSNTPLKKLGNIEDISKAIIFTIENNFLNATVLEIDGGLCI